MITAYVITRVGGAGIRAGNRSGVYALIRLDRAPDPHDLGEYGELTDVAKALMSDHLGRPVEHAEAVAFAARHLPPTLRHATIKAETIAR